MVLHLARLGHRRIGKMPASAASRYGIKAGRSAAGQEETILPSNKNDRSFCVDRTRSGAVSSLFTGLGVQCGAVTFTNDVLTVDVFLDTSMVEAQAGGHESITTRVYPPVTSPSACGPVRGRRPPPSSRSRSGR
ncbi:GH32 C-terminal domain-containing protein [Nonomuraea rubra]|uniref:GH32 C-terminal domain-containing protein n=1 Tax=Nonomuraea rubra TaxID=46180 RepID=UPI0033F6B599